MRNFDSDEDRQKALVEATDWLLQVASEHACNNIVSPLVVLFREQPIPTLKATIGCQALCELLPEMIALETIPRRVVIDAFRQCRAEQDPDESAEAAERLDSLLAFRREVKDRQREQDEKLTPVVEWTVETGFTFQDIVERLFDAGRVTLDDLDNLFADCQDDES